MREETGDGEGETEEAQGDGEMKNRGKDKKFGGKSKSKNHQLAVGVYVCADVSVYVKISGKRLFVYICARTCLHECVSEREGASVCVCVF